MRKRTALLLFLILLILSGCARAPAPTPLAPTLSSANASATSRPSATFTRTPALTATATTPPPSPTATEDACIFREVPFSPEAIGPGTIIFSDGSNRPDSLSSLSSQSLELQQYQISELGDFIDNFLVSPDGQYFVYGDDYLDNMIVVSSNPDNYRRVSMDREGWGNTILGWLADSQRVFIYPHIDPAELDFIPTDKVIVFNLFTGEERLVEPSFTYPKGSTFSGYHFNRGNYALMNAVYDPTLSRVVYLEDEETLVMWDMENQREIWRMVDPLIQGLSPVWSPDGSHVILVDWLGNYLDYENTDEFQLVIVSRDGQESRSPRIPYYSGLIPYFTWSPDGRFLSYYWRSSENEDFRLFLYNVMTNDVLDVCLVHPTSGVVWSPDSRQFILNADKLSLSGEVKNSSRNLIIDVEQGIMMELPNIELYPEAWLITSE